MRNVVRYRLEFAIFQSVVFLSESYKFAVANRTIEFDNISYYLDFIIEFISRKTLFNGAINRISYNIDDFYRGFDLFN